MFWFRDSTTGKYQQPVCVVVNTQVASCQDLAGRSLRSLGIVSGRALVRMHFVATGMRVL